MPRSSRSAGTGGWSRRGFAEAACGGPEGVVDPRCPAHAGAVAVAIDEALVGGPGRHVAVDGMTAWPGKGRQQAGRGDVGPGQVAAHQQAPAVAERGIEGIELALERGTGIRDVGGGGAQASHDDPAGHGPHRPCAGFLAPWDAIEQLGGDPGGLAGQSGGVDEPPDGGADGLVGSCGEAGDVRRLSGRRVVPGRVGRGLEPVHDRAAALDDAVAMIENRHAGAGGDAAHRQQVEPRCQARLAIRDAAEVERPARLLAVVGGAEGVECRHGSDRAGEMTTLRRRAPRGSVSGRLHEALDPIERLLQLG